MITPEEVRTKTPVNFWKKIKFGEPNECWEWQAWLLKGYGQFGIKRNGKFIGALSHRLIYETLFENFDPKLFCLHRCDNPKCVNPNHLFQGTAKDNYHDMMNKGRRKLSIGSANGAAKLKESQVIEIKKELLTSATHEAIAKNFNVSRPLISMISSGRRWGHLVI